ncbi:cytochrome C [Arcobacter sp. F155]|uniref:c-type cytochrome n=1 Tax=Arcobacteraceae TaxID=2808963 RepID=UPI00100A3917|nr:MULTISPECIES: c-type cytochrome [unclassified Arcobacter]RXJ78793.1 cytochrome C [Arcobacter sp. F155]RXK02628.1 cytochrome C [Arcobacter sp. CECT 8989]
MRKILLLTSILACAAFANPYAKCVACHGANGEKAAMGKSKIIKDMTKAEFVAAMKGYKDGSYGGPMKGLMKGQVAGLSDADIEAIANQIAK